MEWKIGEIKQINGEWYQCVEGNGYGNCAFKGRKCYLEAIGECCYDRRRDNKDVIFKKLEKVGEPRMVDGKMVQKLVKPEADGCVGCCFWDGEGCPLEYDVRYAKETIEYEPCYAKEIYVEIKQNKEDMEEKHSTENHPTKEEEIAERIANKAGENIQNQLKKNMNKLRLKPFDIQKAKAGKPVCTRDGRKARIICFDAKGNQPIVALFERENSGEEIVQTYSKNGSYYNLGHEDNRDLMMLPEKKEGWVNVYNRNRPRISSETCDIMTGVSVFETKEGAISYIDKDKEYIATIKIEWEE